MMLWWKERQRHLWWKELRESWAVVGLGWFIIIVFAYKIPAELSARYVWGMDFNMTATAIMLFVSLVLGVTAYAVEEEYETLEPLMAKPIPLNDILATKLGVRLGLIFSSALLIGIIELVTSAWPIEYGIPSPVIFERWMGSLMIMICGLGLGFYFGKVLGRQITALLSAGLIFAASWVLLSLSPLAFFFEGEEGKTIYWIKQILLPGLLGTVAILASIRARIGEGTLLTRPAVAAAALAGYALLSWSLTIVPPGRAWVSGEVYFAHWAAQLGSPEAGLNSLVNMYTRDGAWDIQDNPDSISTSIVLNTTIYSPSRLIRTERYAYSSLLGVDGRVYRTYPGRSSVYSRIPLERLTADNRSADWIGECLEIARQPGYSEHHQLIALHLAGLADHPGNTEAIAVYLDSPSQNVRLMTAFMLLAREDPRGTEALKTLVIEIDEEVLLRHIAYVIYSFGLDLGPQFQPLMRDWLTRGGQENRPYRDAARFWYRHYGSDADLDLIRSSLWLNVIERYRQITTLEDMQIWSYLEDWNSPEFIDELYLQSRRIINELTDISWEAHGISDKDWRRRTDEDRLKLNRFSMLTRNLRSIITELSTRFDPLSIELWGDYYRLNYNLVLFPRNLPYITYLPGMGEIGIRTLQELVDNTKAGAFTRFQAALILAYHDYNGYDARALRFYELYRETRFLNYLWRSEPYNAFLVLVEKGDLQFAGPIIEEAWKVFENKGRYSRISGLGRIYMRVGTNRWNNRTAEVLEAATGKNYGWDIKAWKRWWDREGKALAMAGN